MTLQQNARVTVSDLSKIHVSRATTLIDVTNPSMHEIKALHEKCKISMKDINACLDPYESPRVKQTKDYMMLIYSKFDCNKDTRSCTPIGFFVTKRFVVVIHKQPIPFLQELDVQAVVTKELFKAGTEVLLFKVLDQLIKQKAKVLEEIEDEIEGLEDDVLDSPTQSFMREIFALKNKLLYLRKSIVGNRAIMTSLVKEATLKEKGLFAELSVDAMQLSDMAEMYRERLTSLVEIYMSVVSNRINQVMKSFTVIASVLLLPMLVSGVYGMNISLPFQQHPQAFWIVLGIMTVSIILMLWFFKNKKWL